jgi:hypothetical protein
VMKEEFTSSPAAVRIVHRLLKRRVSVVGDETSSPEFLVQFEDESRAKAEWISIFHISELAIQGSEWAIDGIEWLDSVEPAEASHGLALISRKRQPGNFKANQKQIKSPHTGLPWKPHGYH